MVRASHQTESTAAQNVLTCRSMLPLGVTPGGGLHSPSWRELATFSPGGRDRQLGPSHRLRSRAYRNGPAIDARDENPLFFLAPLSPPWWSLMVDVEEIERSARESGRGEGAQRGRGRLREPHEGLAVGLRKGRLGVKENGHRLANAISYIGTGGPRLMLTQEPEYPYPYFAFVLVNTTDEDHTEPYAKASQACRC